jgi:outer membrane protein TolC
MPRPFRSLLRLAVPALTGIGLAWAVGLRAQEPGRSIGHGPGTGVELLPIETPQPPRPGHSLPFTPGMPDAPFVPAPHLGDEPLPPDALEGLLPWWYDGLNRPLRPDETPLAVNLETLAWRALRHSPRVLALQVEPLIEQTEIVEEAAAFDWRGFVDSNGSALSDPVGNTLTTGGASRFRDRVWVQDAGVRKRNVYGGEFQVFQRLGLQSNNSLFFSPTDQATTRLEMRVTQPLLGRSGKAYNTSRVALARIDTEAAAADVAAALQDHVVAVTEAYWELYRARSVLQQKVRSLSRAEFVLEILEGRRGVDASERQILRARAAVATRRSELARVRAAIRNSESRLRLLVNDPELTAGPVELLPDEVPRCEPLPLAIPDALATAMNNRPEIAEAARRLHEASVKLGMARSEFLPQLDLVLGAYVAGLRGDFDVATSWENQFTAGQPGYIAGMLFEMPLRRRAERARVARQEHEYRRAALQLDAVVQQSLTETEIAVRTAEAAYREIVGKLHAMDAAEAEAVYLYDRWRLLAGDEQSTTLLLEDLLDAQERVAQEEAAFTAAQVSYAVALVQIKRAMGTLLQAGTHPCEPVAGAGPTPTPQELPQELPQVLPDAAPDLPPRFVEPDQVFEPAPLPEPDPRPFGHSIPLPTEAPAETPSLPTQPMQPEAPTLPPQLPPLPPLPPLPSDPPAEPAPQTPPLRGPGR